MNTTDPIADMLTRIRNANSSKHKTVDIPASNMKLGIAEILFKEGYIKSFEEIKEKIENEEIAKAIIVEKQDNNVKIRYIVENTNFMDEVPETIVSAINSLYTNIQISKLSKWKFIYNDGNVNSIILCNIFLCLPSIKFDNNRKNIKNNGNISNINES